MEEIREYKGKISSLNSKEIRIFSQQDQESRLGVLKSEQEDFLVKANLIEKNIKDIEAIINVKFFFFL